MLIIRFNQKLCLSNMISCVSKIKKFNHNQLKQVLLLYMIKY